MKRNAKEKYQKLLDCIEFPAMIYLNETGRVLALNFYGRKVLSTEIKNIDEIMSQEFQLCCRRVIQDIGREFFNDIKIHVGQETMDLDIELNSISVDTKHLVICFFDKSYKQSFVKGISRQVPRLFFKDANLEYVHGSQFFLQDTKVEVEQYIENEKVLNIEECNYIKHADQNILKEKCCEFNAVLNGIVPGYQTYFIRLHRVPVLNVKEEAIGILGIYTLILSKKEYREIYDEMLRENYTLNKIITRKKIFVLRFGMKKGWPVYYASPNFKQIRLVRYGLYEGTVFWKDFVHPDDYGRIYEEMKQLLNENSIMYPVLSYRIRNFSGKYIWVTDETSSVEKSGDVWYRESVIQVAGDG